MKLKFCNKLLDIENIEPKDLNTTKYILQRSLQYSTGSLNKNYHNRILDWQEEGTHIQKLLREYNWEYRKKICVNCSLYTQKKLKCYKEDNFKDGIQETYCSKMTKARSQKFRKMILKFMRFHPSNSRM